MLMTRTAMSVNEVKEVLLMRIFLLCLFFVLLCSSIIGEKHGSDNQDEQHTDRSIRKKILQRKTFKRKKEFLHCSLVLPENGYDFLTLEASETTTVKLQYSYTTYNHPGVCIFVSCKGNRLYNCDLPKSAPQALHNFWTEQEIPLSKGINTLSLTGKGIRCEMIAKIIPQTSQSVSLVLPNQAA